MLAGGGLLYLLLQALGLNSLNAGIWTQTLLIAGLLGWLATYLYRAVSHNLTYHQQRDRYDEAFLQQQLEQLSPEELARLQEKLAQEEQENLPPSVNR